MGDIADDIIDGAICQICCCPDDEEPRGYPYTCAECGGDSEDIHILRTPSIFEIPDKQKAVNPQHHATQGKSPKVKCPHCDKMVAEVGLQQHVTAKHNHTVVTAIKNTGK